MFVNFAHRGASEYAPENTMLAFREAVNTIGIDIIESDLYLTKDGYLVYNHDSYIDETCNINGDISLKEVDTIDNEIHKYDEEHKRFGVYRSVRGMDSAPETIIANMQFDYMKKKTGTVK